ncbi:hypothetical protein ACFQI7_12490 [Paenibacillus allorhizosphaerae]|uniref:hypothetical protein n=1 Tax=Paenibacillus allorhizosphaerae TaxID=2849866 RepID=UPI001C40393E|nr:hypothetical protein [Paenibacillus allorhizosphaerae]
MLIAAISSPKEEAGKATSFGPICEYLFNKVRRILPVLANLQAIELLSIHTAAVNAYFIAAKPSSQKKSSRK